MDVKKLKKAYEILSKYDVMDRISVVFGIYRPIDETQFIALIMANHTWIKDINVFLDMDNTLFRFSYGRTDDLDMLEKAMNEGFYRNLEPMKHIDIYEVLTLIGVNVYILSACPKSKYVKKEKRECLAEHMPYIKTKNILFCNVGDDKAALAKKRIGSQNFSKSFLVDDYKYNLLKWQEAGGIPIKKAMSYKTRPYATLLDHKDVVDMIISLSKELFQK